MMISGSVYSMCVRFHVQTAWHDLCDFVRILHHRTHPSNIYCHHLRFVPPLTSAFDRFAPPPHHDLPNSSTLTLLSQTILLEMNRSRSHPCVEPSTHASPPVPQKKSHSAAPRFCSRCFFRCRKQKDLEALGDPHSFI